MSKQVIEIMRFSVGSHQFGVERQHVQSVQHGNLVRVLPTDDGTFKAILKTNEGDLPVLRLVDFLNEPVVSKMAQQRLLILHSREGLWCLLVDSVSQADFLPASAIRPLPKVTNISFADTVFVADDTIMLILSPDKINPNRPALDQPALPKAPPIRPVQPTANTDGHLVLFQLPGTAQDDTLFAVGLTPKQINEVLRNVTLQSVPAATNSLKGVITWRGQLVPVMDLGQRLGLVDSAEQEFKKQDRIVIAHGVDSDQLLAFYADASVDVLHLPAPHKPSSNTAKIEPNLIHGAAEYAGQTVIIPHIANIMAGVG